MTSAFEALRSNGLRSLLTMLGVAIGVGSVVMLVAIGQGVERDVMRQLESLGQNALFILPGKLDRSGQPNPMALMGISTLTEADLAAIGRVPGVAAVTPIYFLAGAVEHGGRSSSAMVIGTTEHLLYIRKLPVAAGRYFTAAENDSPVCVLGHDAAEEVFGTSPPVGQKIQVRGRTFTVVGVRAAEEASLLGQTGFGSMVYLPAGIARRLFPEAQINRIHVDQQLGRNPDPVIRGVQAAMLASHGGRDDFSIVTQRQLLGALFQILTIVEALLLGITSISLVVAGIGIMNIMLVTVTERTREIGIRKTVGARQSDIFVQFLTEAVTVSCAGGAVGTTLAWLICTAISARTALHPVVTAGSLCIAFGVCLLVGVVFGVAPAMRAARMDPIAALRWE